VDNYLRLRNLAQTAIHGSVFLGSLVGMALNFSGCPASPWENALEDRGNLYNRWLAGEYHLARASFAVEAAISARAAAGGILQKGDNQVRVMTSK
jgi:hypothetical protein